jgi:y4mF family transcriptional regulator
MIRIATAQDLGHAVRAARKQLGLTQAQLSLAAGVGLRFIVDLEAGTPTLRLEHVLRVVDSLGGEFILSGFASSQCESSHPAIAPEAADAHDARAARLQALDELAAQAQELKMGYE